MLKPTVVTSARIPSVPLLDYDNEYITESGMSPEGQLLLIQLTDISNSVTDDYEGYIAALTNIENNAANTLGQDEMELIFEVSSVARESAWYWRDNTTYWWLALDGNPANCEQVCVEDYYSRQSVTSFVLPRATMQQPVGGFQGPICVYTCTPAGKRIGALIFSADVSRISRDGIAGFILKRATGTVINWQVSAAQAAASSITAAAGIAIVSWYF
jgi:hypothetical protein